MECFAVPATLGVRLTPADIFEADAHAFNNALSEQPDEHPAGTSLDAARILATAWRVKISFEQSQLRFTLPEPLRRAKQVASAGETAVVFAFKSLLEISTPDVWFSHVRSLSGTSPGIIGDAIQELTGE